MSAKEAPISLTQAGFTPAQIGRLDQTKEAIRERMEREGRQVSLPTIKTPKEYSERIFTLREKDGIDTEMTAGKPIDPDSIMAQLNFFLTLYTAVVEKIKTDPRTQAGKSGLIRVNALTMQTSKRETVRAMLFYNGSHVDRLDLRYHKRLGQGENNIHTDSVTVQPDPARLRIQRIFESPPRFIPTSVNHQIPNNLPSRALTDVECDYAKNLFLLCLAG